MKNALAVLAAILLLTGCQKFIDKYYYSDPVAKLCKLKTVKTVGEFQTYFQTYYQNKWGEPDSAVYEDTGTGSPALFFTYDKTGRLIKHTETNQGTYYYVYEHGGILPVRDTLRDYYTNIFVQRFTYDSKGRITKMVVDWLGSDLPDDPRDDYEVIYRYNEKGNLIKSGPITYSPSQYDNKVNYLRTSKVLQFIHRDYSMNNRITAAKYNKAGLPELYDATSFPPGAAPYIRKEITYTCK